MIRTRLILPATLIFLISSGCTQHKVEVAPVEVDKALDDFFGDVDSVEEKIGTQSTAPE
jgi:hypothetical protein